MNPVKIATCGKGLAKAVNPHPYNYEHSQYPSLEWDEFDTKNQPYPTYKDGKLFLEEYEGEAELVWQYRNASFNDKQHGDKYWSKLPVEEFATVDECLNHYNEDGFNLRQVWNILPSTQTDKPIDMKTFKGTPGPWSVGLNGRMKVSIWNGSGASLIATISEYPHIGSQANAHLIAASPDLLEAVQKLREFIDDVTPSCAGGDDQLYYVKNLADKAINKALGD